MSYSVARDITYATGARSRSGRLLIKGMEALGGRIDLLRRAEGYDRAVADGAVFWEEITRRFGLHPRILRGSLDSIPATGPVVVVANHPYGILDGLILSLLLARARPGCFKVIANDVFLRSPELAEAVLPVCFDGTRDAMAINLAMRRDAVAFLAAGGIVGVFPGGAVSTARRPLGAAWDPPWRGFSAKLIRQSGATVVPIHFEGSNSRLFQLASHLHATLRLGLLIREFRARTDGPVRLSIGRPIGPAEIAAHPGNQTELMDWLRGKTYEAGGAVPAEGFDWDRQRAGCT